MPYPHDATNAQRRFMMEFGSILYNPLFAVGLVEGIQRHDYKAVLFFSVLEMFGLLIIYLWWQNRPHIPSIYKIYLLSIATTLCFYLFAGYYFSIPVGDPLPVVAKVAGVIFVALAVTRISVGITLKPKRKAAIQNGRWLLISVSGLVPLKHFFSNTCLLGSAI